MELTSETVDRMRSLAARCFMSEKGKSLGDFNVYIILISTNTSAPAPPLYGGAVYGHTWRVM